MAKKVNVTASTLTQGNAKSGIFLIHEDWHQKVCSLGNGTWYIHTTKPNTGDPEAFFSLITTKELEENIEIISKKWMVKFYSEGEKNWFISRYPKLVKVTGVSFKENGEFQANENQEDPIIKIVKAIPTAPVGATIEDTLENMNEEDQAKAIAILIKKNPALKDIL